MLQKKLVQVPWDIDHPLWVDDDEIEIDYHIRHLGLPKPGTMQQLEELVGRLHSNFLDRSRPLWEFYVIDGLADGHVAIYTKMHHAAVDGGAGMVLTQHDVRHHAGAAQGRPADAEGEGGQAPDGAQPARRRLQEHAEPARQRAAEDSRRAEGDRQHRDAGDQQRRRALQIKGLPNLTAPKTMLNATITSQRSFAARSMSLADAKAIAKQTDTKLNDVVMAVCAGALRRYLLEKHALPKEPLVAFVPVSLREPGNTETNNQVSGMLCSLATDIEDPLERLKAIRASSLEAKELSGKVKDATPRDFSIFGAPVVLQGAMGLYGRRAWPTGCRRRRTS